MKNTKLLWYLWAAMYAICTVCGYISIVPDFLGGLFTLLSLGFFVPPALLIYKAVQDKNRKILQIIRNLSLISLGLTLGVLLLNLATVTASENWGLAMYLILNLVSSPMICSQVWVVGLFGWACLLMGSILKTGKK